MTLDFSKHKNIMLSILKDIFSDTLIAPYLGFKGGTAALLFYDLDRASVDLDFDLFEPDKDETVRERMRKLASAYGRVMESHIKRFNVLTVIAYDQISQNIKIEVNRRDSGSKYEIKDLLGISMPVMVKEDMFANKLMAMHDRIGRTSRDIYDVYFFANKHWPVNKALIEKRMGMKYRDFLISCIGQLENFDNRKILTGLGELLGKLKKDWARSKLKSDTIFLLKALLEADK